MAFNAGSIEATLTLNRNPFTAGLAAARVQAQKFANEKFEVKVTPRLDREALERIRTTLNRTVGRITLRPTLDREAFERIRTTINRTVGRVTIRPNLDREAFERIRNTINRSVGRITVRVELDRASLERVRAQIEALRPVIRVRIEYDRDTLEELLRRIRDINNAAANGARGFGAYGNSGARAFGRINGAARVVLMTLPLLLPIVGSAITGLIGLVGALTSALVTAGAGLAAFALVGASVFKTINDAATAATGGSTQATAAFKAVEAARRNLQRVSEAAAEAEIAAAQGVSDAQNDLALAVEDAAASRIAAARRVADAEEALTRTIEQAARANAQAIQRVEDAERNVTTAQNRARASQEALNRAREDAIETLEDLKLSLRGAALSEEQAILDLEEAQLRYNAALADGTTGLELRQLELDVRQAQLAVDESKESYIDAQQEAAKWAKTGIEGSDGVRSAQEQLNEAQEGVRDAERQVAEARADANQVAIDGARDIQDAQRDVQDARDAQVKTELDAQRSIADADRRLNEARAEAARVQRDGARDVADAVRALIESQNELAKASGTAGAKLSAAMMRARDALIAVKAEYDALVKRTQDPVADALTANFRAAQQFLKTLDPLVTSTARALEIIGGMAEKYFGSPHWLNFVKIISDAMVPTLVKMFEIVALLVRAVMDLTIAFQPMAQWLLSSIVEGLKDFTKWTGQLAGDPAFHKWVETAKEALKRFWEFLVAVVRFIFEFAYALAPLGTVIFNFLANLFNGLSKMPPEWLNGIALGLSAIFAALLLGASGPVALSIGVILGVAAALATLYNDNENIRKSIDDSVTALEARFLPTWEKVVTLFNEHVVPAWEKAVDAMEKHLIPVLDDLWKKVKDDLVPALENFAFVFLEKILPSILEFWAAVQPFVAWFLQMFGTEIVETVTLLVRVFEGTFLAIAGLLDIFTAIFTGDWEKFGTGLHKIAEGFWTIIAALFGLSLDELKATFDEWDRNMINAWNGFWGGMITQQDGSQQQVTGSWNEFWAASARNFHEQLAGLTKGWVDFWTGFKQGVDEGVRNIGERFRAIGNLFRDPINWVINVVLNDGIMNAWNTVMGWIGAKGLQVGRIPNIPAFAQGGEVQGGIANRDSVRAMLMPGEYVFSKRAIANMGGLSQVDQMHKAARTGSLAGRGAGRNDGMARQALMRSVPYLDDGGIRGFAYGGVQPHVARAGAEIESIFGRLPGGIGGVGGRPNASDHPTGHALDFMTMNNKDLGDRITAHLMASAQRMAVKYLIWQQAINQGGGWSRMEDRGSPTANHYDHIHASFHRAGAGGFNMAGGLPAGGGNFFTDMWAQLGGQVRSLFGGLLNFAGMPGIGSPIVNSATQIPVKLVEETVKQLQARLVGMITSVFGGGPGKAPGGAVPKNVFDDGGIWKSGTAGFNGSGGNERVLPTNTTEDFERLVSILEALVGEGGALTEGGIGGDTYNVMLPPGATLRQLVDYTQFVKTVNGKGRYAKK